MLVIKHIKLLTSAAVAAVISLVPGASQGATSAESPRMDLRPQGETSEAAVKAIMDKWELNKSRPVEVAQAFSSFKPSFIRGRQEQSTTKPPQSPPQSPPQH